MLPEGSGHDTGTQASLRLAYLKTYEHVGVFSVTCVSGCNCTSQKVTEQPPPLFYHSSHFFSAGERPRPQRPRVIDAAAPDIGIPHILFSHCSHSFPNQVNCHVPEEHVSLMQLHQISATQSPVCVMEVTIEAETTSGEHKVRAGRERGGSDGT